MNNKIRLLSLFCMLILTTGIFLVSRSRFWDSKRVERLIKSGISKGDSEKKVSSQLSKLGIKYSRIKASDGGLTKRQEVKDSGLNPKIIKMVIVGESKQGFMPDDRYYTQFFFFFDYKNELIKYDVLKSYAGI